MVLKYIVSNQSMQLHPSCEKLQVVADSKNYLIAQFDFRTDEWLNGPVWALFTYEDQTYKKLLGAEQLALNECYVPPEVIKSPSFTVSLYTGDRIVTEVVKKKVIPSGYTENIKNQNVSPSVLEQIDQLMKGYAIICNNILQDCKKIQETLRGEEHE